MSGVVEDLEEEVRDLRAMVVKLCARAGHTYGESHRWATCGVYLHKDRLADEHHTKCTTCKTYTCEELKP